MSSTYFSLLLAASLAAASPALIEVAAIYVAAKASATVTSHVRHLPSFQGMRLRPSGRISLSRMRSFGSLQDGMDARSRDRQSRSLICWWRAIWPMPSLHERPWVPMLSTHAPQLQGCAAQMGVPSRKPIATRIDSSSRRSPNDAIGKACSQPPLWGAATARRRARSRSVVACWSRMADECSMEARSQLLCRCASSADGSVAEYRAAPNLPCVRDPRILFYCSEQQDVGLQIPSARGGG